MPSGLNKVTKRITKKRQGKLGKSSSLNALHENSRDAQRIRRASARDDKVIHGERERARRNERFLKRLAHIHAAVRLATIQAATAPAAPSEDASMADASPATPVFDEEALHTLVQSVLDTYARAVKELEKERRAGRPKSREQERIEDEMALEVGDYESGFWMVDLRRPENVAKFERWEGRWEGLGNLEFVRVRRRRGEQEPWAETVRGSKFPPTGAV